MAESNAYSLMITQIISNALKNWSSIKNGILFLQSFLKFNISYFSETQWVECFIPQLPWFCLAWFVISSNTFSNYLTHSSSFTHFCHVSKILLSIPFRRIHDMLTNFSTTSVKIWWGSMLTYFWRFSDSKCFLF